ncbi:MAG: hypothetical protein SVK54_00870, partial [candidate division WOR-3 bacterium]|nr:hypothetical protein [candidate division WOR-3 bacterium]
DKKHSAVVEKDFEINIAPDSGFQYSIDDIEYTPNRIAFEITANQNCLVIVGDQFYKPWDVTVDGNSKTLIRANGIFRSVAVKEGTHTIIMKYNSSLQIIALILSILGIVALIIIFIVEKRIIKNRRDHNRD